MHIPPGRFDIISQDEMLRAGNEIDGTMTLLLAGIAGISLVVAGIGVMNVMLVSVTERTREIGIKKALGARRFDILVQFLLEALVLSIIGGVLGIAAGIALADRFTLPLWFLAGLFCCPGHWRCCCTHSPAHS